MYVSSGQWISGAKQFREFDEGLEKPHNKHKYTVPMRVISS